MTADWGVPESRVRFVQAYLRLLTKARVFVLVLWLFLFLAGGYLAPQVRLAPRPPHVECPTKRDRLLDGQRSAPSTVAFLLQFLGNTTNSFDPPKNSPVSHTTSAFLPGAA